MSLIRSSSGDAQSSDDLQKDLTEGVVNLRHLQQMFPDGNNTSCACSANFHPVCTVTNVTRSNACTATCFYSKDVAYYGNCSLKGPAVSASKPASSSVEPLAVHGLVTLMLNVAVGVAILLDGPLV